MSDETMFQQALEAIQQGQRARAKDLITRLLRSDQARPQYWLWMSSLVETTKERTYCLETALRLDPNNAAAKRGLILIGARPPDASVIPLSPPRRKWGGAEPQMSASSGAKGLAAGVHISSRALLIGSLSLLGVFLLAALIFGGVALFGGKSQARPTITRRPSATGPTTTPTALVSPTATRTPNPIIAGATPLSAFLAATFTPTPPYIATPHSRSEAYDVAIRYLNRGRYADMLSFMNQAAEVEPDAPDIRFFIGEAYRLMGEYSLALDAYALAIELDRFFAPAYVGRAQALLALNPNANVLSILDEAIALDPDYQDAYLERAAYQLALGDAPGALADLAALEALNPASPLLFLLRAEANLLQGEFEAALADARRAHELDSTLLPAYHTLARALLVNGLTDEALQKAQVYLLYDEENAIAWLTIGLVHLQSEDWDAALAALDQSLALDASLDEAYDARGLVHLALEDPVGAVNDFYKAVNLRKTSYEYNLHLGQALLAAGNLTNAFQQLGVAENLAESDAQFAAVYYWQAQTVIQAGNRSAAIPLYENLLALPHSAFPAEWAVEANQFLLALTPSPTITLTPSANPSSPTPTRAASATAAVPSATP